MVKEYVVMSKKNMKIGVIQKVRSLEISSF